MKEGSASAGWRLGRRPAALRLLAVHLFVPLLEARLRVAPVPAAVTPSPPAAPERAAEHEEDQEDEQERKEEPEPAEEERMVVAVRGDRGPGGREPLRDSKLIRAHADDRGDDERDDDADASHMNSPLPIVVGEDRRQG